MLVQQLDHDVVLRVEGRGTMQQSATVRRFGERCLSTDRGTFRLDLSNCSYLDSTFLGTLLYLQRKHGQQATGRFGIIDPSPECTRLLQQMGIEELLSVVCHSGHTEMTWVPLTPEVQDSCVLRAQVMQAHRELAAVPGACGEQFRAVAACLEGSTPRP
jgi:anti-anti-sigma factor